MAIFRVRVREGEKELEIEGDKKYIEQMLVRFGYSTAHLKQETGSKTLSPATVHASGQEKMSPAEFILQHQIKKHTDIVIAFGYYLEKYKGMSKFTPADINNCYYEAKMEPSNSSLAIMYNIKKGFLMEAKGSVKDAAGKKCYTLTQSGLQFIEKGFKKSK